MAPAGPSIALILVLGGVALLVGLVLLCYGFWPRRRGDVPHCRRCGYNLTGALSERCPECGTALSDETIVRGERRRRPRLIVAGALALGFAAGSLVYVGSRADWYRLTPTGWVISDLQKKSPTVVARAWREVKRRTGTWRMSASDRSYLIVTCLAEQASKRRLGVTVEQLMFLAECYVSGELTGARAELFFRQMAALELVARPAVVQGDRVPIQVKEESRCPPLILWVRFEGARPILIDGKPTGCRFSFGHGMSGLLSRGSTRSFVSCDELGRHTVSVSAPMKVYHGDRGKPDASRLCYEADVPLETSFEVIKSGATSPVKLIKDPSLRGRLYDAIEVLSLRTSAHLGGEFRYELRFRSPPVNVAFDLIARVGKEEYHLGTLAMQAGSGTEYSSPADEPPAKQFDLILRSNEKVARETIDLYEIWDGELVYENVSVEEKSP